jgi:hypothetical protein
MHHPFGGWGTDRRNEGSGHIGPQLLKGGQITAQRERRQNRHTGTDFYEQQQVVVGQNAPVSC